VNISRWLSNKHLGILSHRWELRTQLLALAMLPVIVFAIVWGAYVIRQQANDLHDQLQQRAQLLTRQMAVAADYGIFSNNLVSLQNLTLAVSKEPAILSATIYDVNQEILATSQTKESFGKNPRTHIRNLLDQSVKQGNLAIGSRETGRITYLEPVRSPTVAIEDLPEAQPSALRPVVSGYAVVEVSSDAIATEILRFGLTVFCLLMGVLFISWNIVRRFSSRIDRRIQAVAHAAQQIGQGITGIRLGRSDIAVFDRLSQDINRMSERLEQSRGELEQRVEQATKAMREQRDTAERANGAKTRFLAAASHDLRQPMHALNMLFAALKHEDSNKSRDDLMQRIEITSQAMSGLLDSLLDISRMDAGGVKPQVETLELMPMLLNLRDTYESHAISKNIEFHVRPSRLWIQSDAMLLHRILGNLISNAIRYTPAGGRVMLAVRCRARHCLIQVRDNGPGIEAQHQQAIFEEFVQIHNPQRDRSLGLGLGLAIVQRLALLLRYPVALRSCPGRGATFQIQVPLAQALPPPHQKSTSDPLGQGSSPEGAALITLAGYRILLVEDDTLVRESYELLLKLWGCEVSSHASAANALAWLRAHVWSPHIILADYRLSEGVDGLQLIRAARRQLSQATPAILVTGNTEEPALRLLTEDTIRVLFKPVKPYVLRATLHELLQFASFASPNAVVD